MNYLLLISWIGIGFVINNIYGQQAMLLYLFGASCSALYFVLKNGEE